MLLSVVVVLIVTDKKNYEDDKPTTPVISFIHPSQITTARVLARLSSVFRTPSRKQLSIFRHYTYCSHSQHLWKNPQRIAGNEIQVEAKRQAVSPRLLGWWFPRVPSRAKRFFSLWVCELRTRISPLSQSWLKNALKTRRKTSHIAPRCYSVIFQLKQRKTLRLLLKRFQRKLWPAKGLTVSAWKLTKVLGPTPLAFFLPHQYCVTVHGRSCQLSHRPS